MSVGRPYIILTTRVYMSIISLFESHTMECLHRKTAACSTTKHGTFWFCGQKPSCEFFCSDENCYVYKKAVAAFRPHRLPALRRSCYNACEWVLHYCNSIHRKSLSLNTRNFIRMDKLLVAKSQTITRICKRSTADVAFIRHVSFSMVRTK